VFGAHLPGTKFVVIQTASSRIVTIATQNQNIPRFYFSTKMYKQTATVLKLINSEIVYTPNENKCI
jgi:hypothetical protein